MEEREATPKKVKEIQKAGKSNWVDSKYIKVYGNIYPFKSGWNHYRSSETYQRKNIKNKEKKDIEGILDKLFR
ncbi:MAG: hypothetical protein Q4Q07_00050 [Tissierellia bacterium]|nr:hypothetical protein [Tissierellia bacterium]